MLLCLSLVVFTSAVYWQVGGHEFIDFDDNAYVYQNPHVREGITGSNIVWAFTSVDAANWHPITWLSHMADAQIFGMNPRGHHLTSAVIHVVSTVLLFLLLLRLSGSLGKSWFVAALFALHPLHVESVAWVAERKDVLSAFFWFLTLYCYAAYVARRGPKLYLLTLACFVMGLMAKPMLVTLPVVLLLLDYWPLNRYGRPESETGRPLWPGAASALAPLLKEKIPFFACSLLSAAVTVYAQHEGGALRSVELMPLGYRVGNAAIAYLRYLVKTLWPRDLAVMYPLPLTIPPWQIIGALLFLLLVSTAAVLARRRHPYLAVGWFWYLVTLVPVIGLVQVGDQAMADRYTYIPLVGLFILAAWGVPALAKDLPYRRGILTLAAAMAITASAAATWRQLGYWQDNVSLFRHALQVTSGNFLAHNRLGTALGRKGDVDAAYREFQEALAIEPNCYETHNNLGFSLAVKGNLDAAIKEYRVALALNPDYLTARANLEAALRQSKRQ